MKLCLASWELACCFLIILQTEINWALLTQQFCFFQEVESNFREISFLSCLLTDSRWPRGVLAKCHGKQHREGQLRLSCPNIFWILEHPTKLPQRSEKSLENSCQSRVRFAGVERPATEWDEAARANSKPCQRAGEAPLICSMRQRFVREAGDGEDVFKRNIRHVARNSNKFHS